MKRVFVCVFFSGVCSSICMEKYLWTWHVLHAAANPGLPGEVAPVHGAPDGAATPTVWHLSGWNQHHAGKCRFSFTSF